MMIVTYLLKQQYLFKREQREEKLSRAIFCLCPIVLNYSETKNVKVWGCIYLPFFLHYFTAICNAH